MRIALAGNPNSGKTTMYNALTGRNEKVGNWAGVTVEKKEGLIKRSYYDGAEELMAVDLPGAYSMSPFTSEESITSAYVRNENPDVIINIVDGTNLSRSLFFTTQLLELGIPVVVALNKSDINEKKDTEMFNLFSPPCFAALGAMNAEMQSKKWLWGGIALQLGTGYTIAVLVYQFGTLLTTGRLGNGFVPGLIAVFAMGAVVIGLIHRTKKQVQAEYRHPIVRKI